MGWILTGLVMFALIAGFGFAVVFALAWNIGLCVYEHIQREDAKGKNSVA